MHKIKMLVLTAIVASLCLPPLVAFGEASNGPVYITGVTPVPGFFNVSFLTPWEDALAVLPPTTTITLSNGSVIPVTLDWTTTYHYFPYAYGNYTAVGTFELPEGVCQPDPPIPLQVTTILRIESGRGLMTLDWEGFNQPGTYVEAWMIVDGVNRTYYYYVPTSYHCTKPVPLVLDLHGGGSNGLAEWSSSRFDRYAEQQGFICVAPNGYPVAFVSAIIDKMVEEYNIDTRRVYAIGVSAGAYGARRLAYEIPDKITAIGLVSGVGATSFLNPLPRPMTVIMWGGTKEWGYRDLVPGMLAAAESLVQQFQCDPVPEITEFPATELDLDELPYWCSVEDALTIAEYYPTSVTRYAWSGGIDCTEVIVYAIHEGGHIWPGGTQYVTIGYVGRATYVTDASETFLEHVKDLVIPEVFEGCAKIKTPELTYEGPAELHICAYAVYLYFDGQWIKWDITFQLKLFNVEFYSCKGELGRLLVTVVHTKHGSYATAVGRKVFFCGSAT